MNPQKLKVTELRKELQKRGLPTTGLKPFLVKRLEDALAQGVPILNDGEEDSQSEGEGDVMEEDTVVSTPTDGGKKRRRGEETLESSTARRVPSVSDGGELFAAEIQRLSANLTSSRKENTKLQFALEEAEEKLKTLKLDARREYEQEFHKEISESRQELKLANKKREEVEFKLSQKEEELDILQKAKQNEKTDEKILKNFKEEVKKREVLQFENEQLKEQIIQHKQQLKTLQAQIDAMQATGDREKRENQRLVLDERAKSEKMRFRMENEREDLVSQWRKEYEQEIADLKATLNRRLRETEKARKDLATQQLAVERKVAEQTKSELQRLIELEGDLRKQESVQLEMQDALAERQKTIEISERNLETEAEKLKLDQEEISALFSALEKEKNDWDERVWVVDSESKKMKERITDLEIKNIRLTSDNRELKEQNIHLQEHLHKHKSRSSMIPIPPRNHENESQLKSGAAAVAVSTKNPVAKENNSAGANVEPKSDSGKIPAKIESDLQQSTTSEIAPRHHRKSMIPIRRGSSLSLVK